MDADAALTTVAREEWGRLVAQLLARHRRLDLVEDAVSDAFEAAVRQWQPRPDDPHHQTVPANPTGWIRTVAERRIVDRVRAEAMARRKYALLAVDVTRQEPRGDPARQDLDAIEDDVLRLILMCTHPAINTESAAALALRLVLGVSTANIAHLFLVKEATMAARITRAKQRIVTTGIPLALPTAGALPDRMDSLSQTIHLAFTAGYAPAHSEDLISIELAGEAIRLARQAYQLRPDPALRTLLALMLLQHSRRHARLDDDGDLVLLADQDRRRWHHEEITEAVALLDGLDPTQPLTTRTVIHLLQASIAAEHATAATAEATRWHRIVDHFDHLLVLDPSPAAGLARAVAVAEAQGPQAGLASLDQLGPVPGHRPWAVRAELHTRCGEVEAARHAYEEALSRCRNAVEHRHLTGRLAQL
ncbi:RNA polymerase sigma factor [Parenemella sanctibonifatiensis]|uniref:RNA polymerase sigma factor n=1 Tax=Parenemella sanctibonifatiensis TaxID=2016505 RepID=UPI001E60D99C|nr:DUF6596 domain-containing protein [Parenemella sanctibonifatiensis]